MCVAWDVAIYIDGSGRTEKGKTERKAEVMSAFQRGGRSRERRDEERLVQEKGKMIYVGGGLTQDQQADTHQPRKQKRQPKSTKQQARIHHHHLFLFSPQIPPYTTAPRPHHPLAKASRPPPAHARAAGSCTAPGVWAGATASDPSSRAPPPLSRPRTAPVAMSRGGLGFGFDWEGGGQRAGTNKVDDE